MKITTTRGTEIEVEFAEISQYGERMFSFSVPKMDMSVERAKLWPKAKVPFLEFSAKGQKAKCELKAEDVTKLIALSAPAFSAYEEKKRHDEDEKYAPLEEQLPEAPTNGTFHLGQKEAIQSEIRKIEKQAARFTGPEDEGINIGIRRGVGRLQNSCPHEWKHEVSRGHTHDARREVKRLSTCQVCGKNSIQKVSEGF